MDDYKENGTLQSLSQELMEQSENKDEVACMANECMFTRWSKPVSVHQLMFVSKDVLLIHIEKALIFYNIRTQKENILVVGGKNSTPEDGHTLNLDGIGCIDCCGIDLLALSEQPPLAKVIICRYPDLKVLATLIDSSNPATYMSILFLRLEYLIGLRDYPAFDLIVWAWRVQEKLLVVDTGFIMPNQSLSVSATGHDVWLSQTERCDVRCRLQLWTVFVGSKTVYADRTPVEPLPADVGSGCWTPGGWFVFCGPSSADVYRVRPGAATPQPCGGADDDAAGRGGADDDAARRGGADHGAFVCHTRQGFAWYAAGRLTFFKDTKGVFTKTSIIIVDHTLRCIVSGENDIYGWSDEGYLLELTQKNERQKVLKVYGTNVKYFTFIKPADKTVATINGKNILQVWNVLAGELKSEMQLNGPAIGLCSNPLYGYIIISFENGKLELLSAAESEVNVIEQISKIVLCDEELSSVRFFSDGEQCIVASFPTGQFYRLNIKLGQTCTVVREHYLEKRVIDFEIFKCVDDSSFLTVLYKNDETTEVAGNNIAILDSDFNAVFELKDTQLYFTSVFKWNSFNGPNIIHPAFAVLLSKSIHSMTIDTVQAKVLDRKTLQLEHNVRNTKVFSERNYRVTFSHDGTYNLYEFHDDGRREKIVTVNCSHWQTGGLEAARVDAGGRNVLTLSRQGNFMCTSFKETCHRVTTGRSQAMGTSIITGQMKTEGIGSEDEPDGTKRMTWAMISKQQELNEITIAYSERKNQIAREFEEIKNELFILLEKNINGPDDAKIDIEEFDLNVDYRLTFKEKCRTQRNEYETKILGDINAFKTETTNILKEHWESLFIKPRSIHCLNELYKVDNYPISIIDQEVVEKANRISKERALNKNEQQHASAVNKSSSQDNFQLLDDDIMSPESEFIRNNDQLLTGSISHKFIDTIEYLNPQYNYYKLEMAEDEIVLLQFTVNKLKHHFNKLFDDMFVEKQRQLDHLKEHNNRLRVIETEFKSACKVVEPTGPSPVDYEWSQYEKTELLTYVQDDEVHVKPYQVLSSEQICIDDTENKCNEPLLAYDNFRQRALMDMMDGVLEKKWEDELKKDVLQPQCMMEKNPEDYTEDDLNAINGYKQAALARSEERIKYKKILEEEKIKINQQVKDIIDTFDSELFKLFQIKLKYNSAINQEYLKINRLSKMLSDSNKRKQLIKLYKDNNVEIEKSIVETTKKITKTEAVHNSLLNTIEVLKHKNNVINKRFKSEFPSKLIYEQALIAYNRRPKLQGSKNYSSLLGYQFVNTILDPTTDKLDLLCSEFVKYLDTLRMYDDYKYVEDYKLNMDRETWHKVCNFRRMKIESEFKISTYQKDAMDKANLLDSLMRDKEFKEVTVETFITSINALNNEELQYRDNPEVQLVVKQGNTEIELTGHFKDFNNTTLIDKSTIEQVNNEIKEMGKLKIDMLSNLLTFKRKCRFLKWEHAILKKHKITLYKHRCDVITSMKVTENVLRYLKSKSKGMNIANEAEQKVEKELAGIQIAYSQEKKELVRRLDELTSRIQSVKGEIEVIDENIEQMSIRLSELKSKLDYGATNRLNSYKDIRMKNIVKRAQMITSIQELHKEVHMLQNQLELLLLKTFPTLYTTPQNASIQK